MRCPFCLHNKTQVVDSRDSGEETRRRRLCAKCEKRFTTYERVEKITKLTVIKKDHTRLPFNKEKVRAGVEKACYKRPVSVKQINDLVDRVEEELFHSGREEVTTEQIGNLVADMLKHLDSVSYVRFASVYRDFGDIEDVRKAIEEVREAAERKGRGERTLF